jgi:hypothetical protein
VSRALAALALGALLCAGLALAWLAHDAPLEPGRLGGLLRADALSALALIVAGAHGLVALTGDEGSPWRLALAAGLTGCAALMGHLGAAGSLLVLAAALHPAGEPGRLGAALRLAPAVCVALGLASIGALAGEWRYGAPAAGSGLNSAGVGLVLAGALLGIGVSDLARGRAPQAAPLVALGALYGLLRLFSLGPWNLGWLLAALLAGGGGALLAAWAAAGAPAEGAGPWLELFLGGVAVAGVGLASGAGVTAAGYALLLGPVARLGLRGAAPGRSNWVLSAAAPLSGPFIAAWMAVAAAVAGGMTALAAALWAAALLAALPAARLALTPAEPLWGAPRTVAAALLSAGLGVLAPLVVAGLLAPVAAQLQGGLTPFGEIELWPWAGLIAYNAARMPVATLPSAALAALMLILSALAWVALRLGALRGR